jgi:hypothetical protein
MLDCQLTSSLCRVSYYGTEALLTEHLHACWSDRGSYTKHQSGVEHRLSRQPY